MQSGCRRFEVFAGASEASVRSGLEVNGRVEIVEV